jgi:hypothetical protein
MVAVAPRKGSVSSCSGEGNARGATDTRAAASRIAAAEVVTSALDMFDGRESEEEGACPDELGGGRMSAKEFRSR